MLSIDALPIPDQLSASGETLELSADAFGFLHNSSDIKDDPEALRGRMQEEGYLYLPGLLDRGEVLEVRKVLTERLARAGAFAPGTDPMAAIAHPSHHSYFAPELAENNPSLMRLLYDGPMMSFYARFFGGAVRHFDFTWLRAVGPGAGTNPHCDIVYMGRGTIDLLTAWTPLGDIPLDVGGLMVLEDSHKHEQLRAVYGRKDADEYCENRRPAQEGPGSGGNIGPGGALSHHPVQLRRRLGGRWLSASFQAGDVLTFSMFTVHASLDNASDQVRLSSDTRYQLASEPIDERWIGENPIGHGLAAKKGRIC